MAKEIPKDIRKAYELAVSLENKFALYKTENKIEYLIRKDGQLVSENKLNPLEEYIAFVIETPYGKTETITDVFNIPLSSKIHFYKAKDLNRIPDKNKTMDIIRLKTGPITAIELLTEKQAREYLTTVDL